MSIAKNSTFLTISQFVVLVLGIVASIVVSRTLGPANRGAYFLFLTIIYMTTSFGNFGLGFTNIYLLSKGKRTLSEVNSSSIILAVLIGLFFMLIYFSSYSLWHRYILKGIDPLYATLACCLVPLVLYDKYWEAMMSGLNKFELLSKFNIVSAIAGTFCTLFVLLILEWGITGMISWWVLNTFILTLARVYILSKLEKFSFSFNWGVLKEMLRFGLKGHIGDVAYSLSSRLDMFIVNFYTGATGVGHYSLAVSLAEKIWFLSSPLKSASAPIISGSNRVESARLTAKVNRHGLFLLIISAIILALTVPWGIPLFYGIEYSPSVIPFLVLLPGVMFGRAVFSEYITGQLGKPQISSLITIINTVLYIPFSIFFIWKYGVIGAAFASSIFYLLQFISFYLVFKKETKLGFSEIIITRFSDIEAYRTMLIRFCNQIKSVLLTSCCRKEPQKSL